MDGFESRLALDRKGHPIGCPFFVEHLKSRRDDLP